MNSIAAQTRTSLTSGTMTRQDVANLPIDPATTWVLRQALTFEEGVRPCVFADGSILLLGPGDRVTEADVDAPQMLRDSGLLSDQD